MNILPSLTKFHPSPKLAITTLDSFVVSVLKFIPPQHAPLPPPSFTPNSITASLPTTAYPSLRLPTSQQIQHSLARAVKAPRSCHITPILRGLHWLKITKHSEYSHSLTKTSQTTNLHVCSTSSLFNLLAAFALHLSLPHSTKNIIIITYNWSFLSVCLALSLESTS